MDDLSTGSGKVEARENSSTSRPGSMPCSWRRNRSAIPACMRPPFSWDVAATPDASCTSRVGCDDRSVHRKAARPIRERCEMLKKTNWLSAGLTLAAVSAVASFAVGGVGPAQAAVVYCKTVGVPKGCVARPTPVAAAVVATPVVGVGARRRRRSRCRCSCRHPDEPRWPGQSRRPSLESSLTGGAVAVGKAVRQCQPHPRALNVSLMVLLGAGAQFQLRAAACRAASHVAQAARRLDRARRRPLRRDLKTPAVILDGDAAALQAIGAGQRLDSHRDTFCIGMLDGVGHGFIEQPHDLDDVPRP